MLSNDHWDLTSGVPLPTYDLGEEGPRLSYI